MLTHTGGCRCGRVRFEVQAPDVIEVSECNCTATARHLFCSVCGIKSYYVPRSHPDGFSSSARCLDPGTVTGMRVSACNGREWEQQFPGGRGAYRA